MELALEETRICKTDRTKTQWVIFQRYLRVGDGRMEREGLRRGAMMKFLPPSTSISP